MLPDAQGLHLLWLGLDGRLYIVSTSNLSLTPKGVHEGP